MKQKKSMTRRDFLKFAGAAVVASSGLGYLATRQPEIEFASANCDVESNGEKILVAYASQYGSTSEVAAAVGDVFCQQGFATDVISTVDIHDISPYKAVIVGGPIQASAWKPDAIAFVAAHQAALSKVPVAYFLTCMRLGLDENSPAVRQEVASWLNPVREQMPTVQPVDIGLFAGALDYGKMSYATQALYRAFAENDTDGDYRDWGAIRAWAEGVCPKLIAI